jgi:ATP-dependent DNA ligase
MSLLRERTRPGSGIIEPCLPSPAKAPPSGSGWIHEIKHDGFRILARRGMLLMSGKHVALSPLNMRLAVADFVL